MYFVKRNALAWVQRSGVDPGSQCDVGRTSIGSSSRSQRREANSDMIYFGSKRAVNNR